jgi:hypothetical protein
MRPVAQEKERTGSGDRPGPYELYEAERGPLMWYLRAQGVGEHEAEDAIVGGQPASRLSLRICLSKARDGTMRRSVLTRPALEPAV